MEASKFNSLLKFAIIEQQGGNDYSLYSDHNEQFFFNFSFENAKIKQQGNIILSERQQEKVNNYIVNWCEQKLRDINVEKFEILNAPDDRENGVYGFGY